MLVTKDWIRTQKRAGYSCDNIYPIAAGKLGLYAVAFFGHRGKKGDKAKLKRLWDRILNTHL